MSIPMSNYSFYDVRGGSWTELILKEDGTNENFESVLAKTWLVKKLMLNMKRSKIKNFESVLFVFGQKHV